MTDSQSTTPTTISLHPCPLAPAGVSRTRVFSRSWYWLRIEHAEDTRPVVERPVIWDHGTEYEACDGDKVHGWRCLYCAPTYLVSVKHTSTSNPLHHLRTKHGIGGKSTRKRPGV